MMINFLTNNFNNISFKATKHTDSDSISGISDLPCAKCGNLMMTPSEISLYARNLRCRVIDVFDSNKMKKHKDTKVFKLLQTLSRLNPNTKVEKLFPIEKLSGQNLEDYLEIIEDAKILYKKSSVSINIFKAIKPKLKPLDKSVIGLLEVYAIKYPDNTFEEIFKKPEVANFYKKKYKKQNEYQREVCDTIFNDMKKVLTNLTPEEEETLNAINETVYGISANLKDLKYKKITINNCYRDFVREIKDDKQRKEFIKLIKLIPLIEPDLDRVIGSFIGKNDEQILMYLISNLHPEKYRIENNDDINAAFRICSSCNDEISRMTFKEIIANYPEFQKNLQKQVDAIIAAIKSGKLSTMKDYPYILENILSRKSNGKITIDTKNLTSYNKDRREKVSKGFDPKEAVKNDTYETLQMRIQFILKKLDELHKNPKLNAQVIEAYHHYYKCCKEKEKEIRAHLASIPKAYY